MNRRTFLPLRALVLLGASVAAGASVPDSTRSPVAEEFDSIMRLHANVAHGAQVYETCSACHGKNGEGVSDGTVPAIAGQHLSVIVWALVSFRQGTRVDPRMGHFTDKRHLHSEHDIADVAAYVSRMPPPGEASHGDDQQVARGLELYQAQCSSCHGHSGQGDGPNRYPRLAGQHYGYLLLQAQEAMSGQRINLSGEHGQLLRTLQPTDLTAICDYLSRLRP